ncbi:MAG: hypothetical protein E6929_14910 [Clostridium sp.]|nr:hypothetical protein [Clostridium sp.]
MGCATRIEKGKNECHLFSMINEEWLKEQLSELICDGTYDEGVVKRKVENIEVHKGYIIVKGRNDLDYIDIEQDLE